MLFQLRLPKNSKRGSFCEQPPTVTKSDTTSLVNLIKFTSGIEKARPVVCKIQLLQAFLENYMIYIKMHESNFHDASYL